MKLLALACLLVWLPSFQVTIMKFICDFIPKLFGCHEIGHVVLFKISANAYYLLCQFLFLSLPFHFSNEMMK